jgi:predicted nucleotidyltransferase component of viral defense system
MLHLEGLSPATREVFLQIAQNPVFKPYILISGTALSMQIQHRLSEDLDFCIWKSDRQPVSIPADFIIRNLNPAYHRIDVLTLLDNQLDLIYDDIKITFFADNENKSVQDVLVYNENIRVASVYAIAGMKIGVLFNRQVYRDYYDIYAVLKSGISLRRVLDEAILFKPYLNDRLIAIQLTYPTLQQEENIQHLTPKHNVSLSTMIAFIREELKQMNES